MSDPTPNNRPPEPAKAPRDLRATLDALVAPHPSSAVLSALEDEGALALYLTRLEQRISTLEDERTKLLSVVEYLVQRTDDAHEMATRIKQRQDAKSSFTRVDLARDLVADNEANDPMLAAAGVRPIKRLDV